MKKISVPYASWYQDGKVTLTFPEEWNVIEAWPRGATSVRNEEIERKFASPVGTKKISEIARGKGNAVLVVDDLTRPTPTGKVIPCILNELKKGGIDEDHVTVVMATAAHRPQSRVDLEMKLGKEAVSKLEIFNHNPYENCEYLGVSSRGTPIHINKHVMEADLKIGVGGVYPHPDAGYGGGGKIILPGVAGIETIEANHRIHGTGHGIIEMNENRANIEEVASEAGLDVIVNVVISSEREVAGVFVGDPVKAHKEGVRFAKRVYSTEMPIHVDIAVVNAYPLDTELFQAAKALWAGVETTDENGTIVLLAACPEGRGFHALFQKGGRLWKPPEESSTGELLGERKLWILSQNLNLKDIHQIFPRDALLFKSWDEALHELQRHHNQHAEVAVLPSTPIQVSKS